MLIFLTFFKKKLFFKKTNLKKKVSCFYFHIIITLCQYMQCIMLIIDHVFRKIPTFTCPQVRYLIDLTVVTESTVLYIINPVGKL